MEKVKDYRKAIYKLNNLNVPVAAKHNLTCLLIIQYFKDKEQGVRVFI